MWKDHTGIGASGECAGGHKRKTGVQGEGGRGGREREIEERVGQRPEHGPGVKRVPLTS